MQSRKKGTSPRSYALKKGKSRKAIFPNFTPQELKRHLIKNSKFTLRIKGKGERPRGIEMELSGLIALIPNLKNCLRTQTFSYHNHNGVRSQGTRHFLDANAKAFMQTLDKFYNDAIGKRGQTVSYGTEKLFMSCVLGYRKNRFDSDGCASMLKDWLEPSVRKKGGSDTIRGWGIGITADDYHVTCWPKYSWQVWGKDPRTLITIAPWSAMQEHAVSFANAITFKDREFQSSTFEQMSFL
jgi:hypothetical protein